MSKIVFFCIPAAGHINPTLGVVSELVRRGHEVWYYSYSLFRQKIEDCGAHFVACDDYDQEKRLSPEDSRRIGDDLAFSTKILVDTTLALDEPVCSHMKQLQPDCIVADSMAVWGKAVAMKLHIPFVSSTTTFAFNRYSAKIMKQSLGKALKMLLSMGKIKKDLARLTERGYPIHNILDILQNDNATDTVVYTSSDFQPCADTFSSHYSFVGPSIRPIETTFQKTGKTLAYISMGTVVNDDAAFYHRCIQALADAPCQVVLSVGNQVSLEQFRQLPANIEVHPFVDQMAVLEKADVFLSHCGMNSVNESLWFGVPLVSFPQTTEQGGVAARAEELGAALRLRNSSPKAIRQAVDQVLSDPSYRQSAQKISEGFHACTGAKGAADKILSLCRN